MTHNGNNYYTRGCDGRYFPSKGELHSWEIDIWLKILPTNHPAYADLKLARETRKEAKRRSQSYWRR